MEADADANLKIILKMALVLNKIEEVIQQWNINGSVLKGVLVGVVLSPLFAPIVMFLVPILSLLGVIAAPLIGYGMLGPMQLKVRVSVVYVCGASGFVLVF
jgi:hypothetical protein